jgi:REP element-mobilizing transposase RayT
MQLFPIFLEPFVEMRKRRMYQNGQVLLITHRLKEGLPFVANEYTKRLALGILSRASFHYPSVGLCAVVLMGNHFHMVVNIRDGGMELSRFCEFTFGEIARVFNRLLGRSGEIWNGRYDAMHLLDPPKIIEKIAYTVANPVLANLVDRSIEFPGLSSANTIFGKNQNSLETKWISSSRVSRISSMGFTTNRLKQYLKELDEIDAPSHCLTIDPLGWCSAFPAFAEEWTREQILLKISNRVIEIENQERKKRTAQNRKPLGAGALSMGSPWRRYRPKKWGRRSLCIAEDRELVRAFRDTYRSFCEKCVAAWTSRHQQFLESRYPPGAFIPARAMISSVIL